MRKSIVLWIVSVSAAAAISAGLTAQVVQPRRAEQARILFGDNVGFRVEGQEQEMRTDTFTGRKAPVDFVSGQIVFKINGQWVEAHVTAGGGVRPATN